MEEPTRMRQIIFMITRPDKRPTLSWNATGHLRVRPESGHVEKHICWICQEELSSETLLLGHYENHMIGDVLNFQFTHFSFITACGG